MASTSTIPPTFLAKLGALRGKQLLVTGGCGFLGRNIVELALEAGARVRVFDVFIREFAPDAKEAGQLSFQQGDLLDNKAFGAALAGCWAVIHVASPSPLSKNAVLFRKVNVEGTEAVLESCRRAGVKRVVYTSSASVVYDGTDQKFLDEETKICTGLDDYTRSKLDGERAVLRAAGQDLWTCALRPHAIFGPYEPHLMPKLKETGRAGKSRYIVGPGTNVVDFTYVTNVAYAHLLAAVALEAGAAVCGQAYFITNKEPLLFWSYMTRLFVGHGYPQPWLRMPLALMAPLGKLMDVYERRGGKPVFTTQVINYTGRHHYYCADKATRDFGYMPPVRMNEAIRRTLAASPEAANPKRVKQEFNKPPFPAQLLTNVAMIVAALFAAQFTGLVGLWMQTPILVRVLPAVLVVWRAIAWWRYFFAKQKIFRDMPDLSGKWLIISGGNRGIGQATVEGFVRRGASVIMGSRDVSRGAAVKASLMKIAAPGQEVEVLELDLATLSTVEKFVKEAKQLLDKRGVRATWLINNAGAMLPKDITEDGMDLSFQTNHLGPFLLTNLALDHNLLTDDARIVVVSSSVHYWGSIDFANLTRSRQRNLVGGFPAYANVKLANVLFANELHWRRCSGTGRTAVAVHPGTAETDFFLHFLPAWLFRALSWFWPLLVSSNFDAAQTSLYAALSPELKSVGGVYLDNSTIIPCSDEAANPEIASRLWIASADLVGYSAPTDAN